MSPFSLARPPYAVKTYYINLYYSWWGGICEEGIFENQNTEKPKKEHMPRQASFRISARVAALSSQARYADLLAKGRRAHRACRGICSFPVHSP